jgi:hypothetical protein
MRLGNTKITTDYPISPIVSKLTYPNLTDFDNLNYSVNEEIPNIFLNKEEIIPVTFLSLYGNFFLSQSSVN